ncbi:MAG: helix-turn-helix domain-containing protein [Acidobacteriota bacterium]
MPPQTTFSALVGWVIANERARLGLTQAALASKMELPQSSWSRLESGQTLLTVDQLDRVAHHLQITAHEIMNRAEQLRATLTNQGVQVNAGARQTGKNAENFLWGAALGALVTALLLGRN